MSLISFICNLFRSERNFTALETLILNGVREQLPFDWVHLWDQQVQEINKIQRLPEGVEVDFYRIKNGRPSFDADLAFPIKAEELLLAKVKVALPNLSNKLEANIWCVNGFLFSIEFGNEIKYFDEICEMDPRPEFIVETALIANLSSEKGAY